MIKPLDKIPNMFRRGGKFSTALGVILFAGLMTALLILVRAAAPFMALEGEEASGTNVAIGNDADASGGEYAEFTAIPDDADFDVVIETPSANTVYASGSSVAIGAKLTGSGAQDIRVEFYQNGVKVDERPRTPYLGVFEKPQNGSYQLVAIAIDGQGKRATSPTINVTVGTGDSSCSGVNVTPGQSVQSAVNSAGSGGTVCFGSGIHRLSSGITVPNGTKLIGFPGAIVSGGKLITNWQLDSVRGLWKSTGQTQQSTVSAKFGCEAGYPRCGYNEDLFINNVRQKHVDSISGVVSGAFFFDYAADTIWVKDDPNGKTVENAVLDRFIEGSPLRVTVRGLVIERFASPFQDSPIDLGLDSRITGNQFAYNHAAGFHFTSGGQAVGNFTHDNGMQGYACSGGNVLAQSNTLVDNGDNNFAGGSTGGVKCSVTDGLTVKGTISRSNNGNGLWTDIDNINTLYEYNLVEDNTKSGIFHEISFAAEIRYNIARRNGLGHDYDKAHGGFWFNNSENVKVHHNEEESNHVTLGLTQVDRSHNLGADNVLKNIEIYENTSFVDRGHVGLWLGSPFSADINGWLSTANISYHDNDYYLKGINNKYFLWKNEFIDKSQWQAFGNDVKGNFYSW